MDTTSHNFTWQIDTLGVTSSVLYDVAIINDTLAYAVGEMYLRDSTGQVDPTPYGLAVWNGRAWTLKRVLVRSQQGSIHSRVFQGVFAFSATDVWFGDGNAFHWDGRSELATSYWISGYPGNPTPVLGPNQGVHRFWGTSSSNLYGVGVNGGIAHYNGSAWQRVESGTTIEISDIYGAMNQRTSSWEILAVAGNPFVDPRRKVLQINGTTVTTLSDSGITRALSGIWFAPGKRYWVVGDGLWYSNYFPNSFHWQNKSGTWTPFALTKIRGNDANDVFTVGSYSEVLHYNGVSIRSFRGPTGTDGLYWSVATKGDRIMAVGEVPPRAVVLRGMRVR